MCVELGDNPVSLKETEVVDELVTVPTGFAPPSRNTRYVRLDARSSSDAAHERSIEPGASQSMAID